MKDEGNQKQKKRISIRQIFILIIFLIGGLVFGYPLISNLVNRMNQTRVISNYESELEKLSEQARLNKLEQAKKYNESLSGSSQAMDDPFGNKDGEQEEVSFLNVGKSMGYIEIPKIEVKLPIYEGSSDEVLQAGVGWLTGTSMPIGGDSTHSVLTGHRGLPRSRLFTDLDMLETGDKFYIRNLEGILTYEVDQIQIILPEEIQYLDIVPGQDYITLLTCHPYMINSHRLLVRGHRISNQVEDDNGEGVMPSEDTPKISFFKKYREYIYIGGALLIIEFFVLLIKKIRKRKK